MFLFPIGFMRAASASAAVDPTLDSLGFTAGGSGSPDSLTATITYTGEDTLELIAVTSTSATAPSQADIEAELGAGTLEAFTTSVASGVPVSISGLTPASNAATYIHAFVREVNNGGVSATNTIAVSGLDFTLPAFASAETTSTTTVDVTLSENIFGTGDNADWTIKVNGSPATLAGTPSISGAVVTLTVTTAIEAGQTLLVSYSAATGDLEDAKGNALASFTDQAVTNNVSAGGVIVSTDFGASFPANAAETTIDTDLVAQADFCTGTHDGALDLTSIDAAITVGAIFGDKTSSYPKIAWRVACDPSTAYEIDIDLVVQPGWAGSPNCRLRIGTAKSDGTHHNVSYASDVAQLHAVRNIAFTTGGAQTEVWITLDNNNAAGGTAGGDPTCSFFEMRAA